MADVPALAIRTALREVLEGTIAGVRAIPSTAMSTDLGPGLMDGGEATRAVSRPRVDIDARLIPADPEETPMGPSNLMVYKLMIEMRRVYWMPSSGLTPAQRDAYDATIMIDTDRIRQALVWPGKLSTTSLGVPTGIVSGCLRHTDTQKQVDRAPPDDRQAPSVEITQTFEGIVYVNAAVTA